MYTHKHTDFVDFIVNLFKEMYILFSKHALNWSKVKYFYIITKRVTTFINSITLC